VYAERLERWSVLREEVHKVEALLQRERARREAELGSMRDTIAQAMSRLQQAERDEQEMATKRRELGVLDTIAAQMEDAERSAAEEAERLATLRSEGERLKDEPAHVRQRLEILGQHDSCPLCGQVLGHEGRAAAQARLEQELRTTNRALEDTRAAYQEQQAVVKAARAHVDGLKAQIIGRQALAAAIGDLESRRRRAEEDRAVLIGHEARASELEAELAAEAFAPEPRVQLGRGREAMEAVGYDADRHRAVRETRDRLKGAPDELRKLEVARATLAGLEAERENLAHEAAAAEIERAEQHAVHVAAAAEAAELAGAPAALRTKEAELQLAGAARNSAILQLGEARQMVSSLDHMAKERAQYAAEREGHLAEVNAYTQLADAFGKNGIQEMIIDAALPEIEDGANGLLDRLSGGRMRVAIETQRTGRTGGTISTLDVNVSDELGTRPYELFSGGEKFRINFAVRIAMSQLLARRANAPLRMLAIDEGFGSQDREGCDRLVEAIKVVQDDFDRILVITHLDELKEVFPVRIEVEKRAGGSTFTIT
jgi:exonuclease SbcC